MYLDYKVLTLCYPIFELQSIFANLDYLACSKIFFKLEMCFEHLEHVKKILFYKKKKTPLQFF